MKFSGSDLQLMRLSVAAISASVVLSGVIVFASHQYVEQAQKDFREAQKMMMDARNRLAKAHQDQEDLAAYSKDYGMLEGRKIIGDDHRLDWIEGLDKLRQQNLVMDFNYSIAPQKNYVPQPVIDSGNFDIHYSDMKLQIDLLHEGQLLNFFNAMHKQINGQYQLESCNLKRVNSIGEDNNAARSIVPHIKAECSGGWITLKNRNAPQ